MCTAANCTSYARDSKGRCVKHGKMDIKASRSRPMCTTANCTSYARDSKGRCLKHGHMDSLAAGAGAAVGAGAGAGAQGNSNTSSDSSATPGRYEKVRQQPSASSFSSSASPLSLSSSAANVVVTEPRGLHWGGSEGVSSGARGEVVRPVKRRKGSGVGGVGGGSSSAPLASFSSPLGAQLTSATAQHASSPRHAEPPSFCSIVAVAVAATAARNIAAGLGAHDGAHMCTFPGCPTAPALEGLCTKHGGGGRGSPSSAANRVKATPLKDRLGLKNKKHPSSVLPTSPALADTQGPYASTGLGAGATFGADSRSVSGVPAVPLEKTQPRVLAPPPPSAVAAAARF